MAKKKYRKFDYGSRTTPPPDSEMYRYNCGSLSEGEWWTATRNDLEPDEGAGWSGKVFVYKDGRKVCAPDPPFHD